MVTISENILSRGVYSVLQMPLDSKHQIEREVLSDEIEWLIQNRVKGFVLAMVSEVMRFTAAERRDQWQMTLDLVAKRHPVIVSVGAESTSIAIQLAVDAASDGASALMATPPALFPATSEEIYNYYQSIIESVTIPLIVQDASNYMGQPLEIELYGRLLEKYGNQRVQFKPEAKPVRERMVALQKIAGGAAQVFEGQSGIGLLDTHQLGLTGTMPGSEIPWAIVALWDALESGDEIQARRIHSELAKLVAFQNSIDAYVAVEKYLLLKQGIFKNTIQRGPVSTILSQESRKEIDAIFTQLQKVVSN
jgi:dihydrodipicolinate synthase/N-acetylneuraminate lyase